MTRGIREGRTQWVDIAKGIAILLVVLHHAVLFSAARGWVPSFVVGANYQLGTFRMPLFFLASGLFAAKTLGSTWTVVIRKRVLFFIYLYVVWVLIRYAFFWAVPNPTTPSEGHSVRGLVVSAVLPSTGLWFVYGLAVFSLVAKLLWRVSVPVQLVAAAALAVAAGGNLVPIDNFAWRRMAMYLVFFLVGAHLAGWIKKVAASTTVPRAAGVLTTYAVASAATVGLDVGGIPGVTLAVSVVAVWAGLSVSVLITGTAIGNVLAYLGRRTIDIYLPHVMVVGGVSAAVAAVGISPTSLPAGLTTVGVLVAVAVPASLVTATVLRRCGVRWLFQLPGPLAYRPAVSSDRTAAR